MQLADVRHEFSTHPLFHHPPSRVPRVLLLGEISRGLVVGQVDLVHNSQHLSSAGGKEAKPLYNFLVS